MIKAKIEVNTGDRGNDGRKHNRNFWGFGDVLCLDLCDGCSGCTCKNLSIFIIKIFTLYVIAKFKKCQKALGKKSKGAMQHT